MRLYAGPVKSMGCFFAVILLGCYTLLRKQHKGEKDVLYHLNNTGDYVENKKISFHTVYEEFIEREGKATRAYATMMLSIRTISRMSLGRCMSTRSRIPCSSTS